MVVGRLTIMAGPPLTPGPPAAGELPPPPFPPLPTSWPLLIIVTVSFGPKELGTETAKDAGVEAPSVLALGILNITSVLLATYKGDELIRVKRSLSFESTLKIYSNDDLTGPTGPAAAP
jgi:hypothetical protein